MNENVFWIICFGGVLVAIIFLIVLANWLTARANQRRADKMMKDRKNGKYNPDKKYFGNQGNWEPGEGASDGTDWNTYNRH